MKSFPRLNTIVIFCIILSLCIVSFFMRLDNFKNTRMRTIDEVVYWRMGLQVKDDIRQYHTIPYGYELAATGRPLPKYFFQPLFKHPPVFTFLIALFLRVFGVNFLSAEYVSLLFGIFMIPLVYFLGKLTYDKRVGLFSALLFSVDPVSIICSQKVWMDTTLSFFIVASIYLFMRGLISQNGIFYILSGVASGLAALTKYPGVLATGAVILYAAFYGRDLFRNKQFITGLIMPIVMFIPWLIWNVAVYKMDLISVYTDLHGGVSQRFMLTVGVFAFVLIAALARIACKLKQDGLFVGCFAGLFGQQRKNTTLLYCLFSGALLLSLFPHIIESMQPAFLPRTTWFAGSFAGEPPTFYLNQLIEFSLIYVLAFLALFFDRREKSIVLRISALLILIFYIAWRNYQSRYILAVIPFLMVLASSSLVWFYDRMWCIQKKLPRYIALCIVSIVVFLIVAKTMYVNSILSFPNDMCYF